MTGGTRGETNKEIVGEWWRVEKTGGDRRTSSASLALTPYSMELEFEVKTRPLEVHCIADKVTIDYDYEYLGWYLDGALIHRHRHRHRHTHARVHVVYHSN